MNGATSQNIYAWEVISSKIIMHNTDLTPNTL